MNDRFVFQFCDQVPTEDFGTEYTSLQNRGVVVAFKRLKRRNGFTL